MLAVSEIFRRLVAARRAGPQPAITLGEDTPANRRVSWAEYWGCRGAMARGAGRVWLGWALHVPAVAVVLWWMATMGQMSWLAWGISVYAGWSILKIRTFLEHRAHEKSRARTVIIESHGPLAWLFLYNSLHVVHHMNPGAAWYDLPRLYREGKERYLACNEAYVYRSYVDIFRQYFLRAKDPVPHPLWQQGE